MDVKHWRRAAAAGLLSLTAVLAVASRAEAAVDLTPDPDAVTFARAISADPSLVVGAQWLAKPPVAGADALVSGTLAGFPTAGGEWGLMTTGDAGLAATPNFSGSTGRDDGGPSLRGNTDFDVSVLRIDLNVPQGDNCLTGIDFRFASDEYPEYVGTAYNDAFIAEVDSSTWTTSGSEIVAPRNFAFDPSNNPISINAAGVTSMRAEFAAGTTYDGATPALTAATPLTPGPHSLYLSIFDQGDHIYDSAVFLDNLRVGHVGNVSTDCTPGAEPVANREMYGLGDSYSSGFGTDPYEPGTHKDAGDNDCQRSTRAFGPLVANDLGLDMHFHACQGAVTRDFFQPRNSTWGEQAQLDYLKPDAALVTFTIGGNDAHFADVLRDCIDGWELLPFNTCHGDDKVTQPVAEAFDRLDGRTATPADIHPYDEVDKAVLDRTPQAAHVAVGYPPFFTSQGSDRTFLPGGRCEGVKKADQRWMVEKVAELNGIIERNALRNGFIFVDPTSRFIGHELCGGGDEWFYPLLSGGRFHPTADGHRAIADAIEEALQAYDPPALQVLQGQTVHYTFFVYPSEAFLLAITSQWPGSDVVMTLVSPSGKRYTRTDPGAGVYHANGPTWEHFEIPSPEVGEWQVELYGADVAPGGEKTTLAIDREAPPNQRPHAVPRLRREGGKLVLDATASSDPDGQVKGYDWYVATAGDDKVYQGETVTLDTPTVPESATLVVTDDKGLTDFETVTSVPVDVLPGSDTNPFNLGADGRLPVALLSTADFDATTVDPSSLRLGPGRAPAVKFAAEDVNGDGRMDAIVHFDRQAIGVKAADTQVCLDGGLPDGRAFTSCDVLSVVP